MDTILKCTGTSRTICPSDTVPHTRLLGADVTRMQCDSLDARSPYSETRRVSGATWNRSVGRNRARLHCELSRFLHLSLAAELARDREKMFFEEILEPTLRH